MLNEKLEVSDEAGNSADSAITLPAHLAEKILRQAAAHAAACLTPEWIAAEAVRARARAQGVGFNFMSGHPKVDGVEYQNRIREAW